MASLQSTSVNGTLSATGAVTLSNYGAGFVKLNASGAIVIDTNSYLSSGSFLPLAGGTMTGILYVETTSDPKIVLRVPAGDTNQWNYINFVGSDGVRDAYFGTDGSGNPQWYRDDNGLNITLGSTATVNGVQIVTNSGTWGISITGNADTVDGYHASGLLKLNEWNGNLYLHTDGRIYGTIFYDSNDSGYYVDPNSESKLYRLNVGGGSHTQENNQAVIKFKNTVDNHNYIVSEGAGWGSWHQWIRYVGSYNTWRIGTFDAAQESGESMWRLAGRNRGSNGELNYIVAGPRGAWGSDDRVILWNPKARYDGGSYNGDGTHHALLPEDKWWNSKYFGSDGAIYGTIFYDTNDGAYHLNPNSSSRLRYLYVGDSGSNWSNPGGWDTTLYISGVNHSIIRVENRQNNYHAALHSHTGQLPGVGSPGDYDFRITRNWSNRMTFYSGYTYSEGYLQAADSLRAPIFYDSNNTSYYLDPSSNTSIRTVGSWRADSSAWDGEFSGKIQYHSNHWYIQGADLFIYRNSGGSNVFTVNQSGDAQANSSMRAPIFYDSNDTGYYLDLNSTSNTALRIRGGALHGPNPTWGKYLYVGTDGRVGSTATVAVTNGNLHIDCEDGYALYLNWYSANNIYSRGNFGVGSDSASYRLHVHGTGYATSDFRAPIFYDSDNTGYYGDFASTSRLNVLDANSIYTSGGLSTNGGNSLLGVQSPGGASRANGGSTETGAFKITLPSGIPVYGMFKLVIHIYEYGQRGNGYEIHCGGHMYPNYMYNRFQVQYGSSNSPLNVRYGNDGTNGCIWIGDTNTTWSYPQIWVSEFMMGYSNTSWTTWRSGWSISLVTSYGNSGAMDGPYTCDYGYAASAGSASTSSQVTINYNDNSNANYQLLWGSGNNVYGTGGVYVNPADDRVFANYFSSAYYMDVYTSAGADYLRLTDNQVYRPNGGILYLNWSSNANVALTGPSGGNVGVGNNSPSYKMHVSGDIYANGGWLRVSGTSGLYFESYGGGWRMTNSSYVEMYNNKSLNMLYGSVDYVGSLYIEGGGQGGHIQPNTTGSYGALQMTGSRNGWPGIYFTAAGTSLMINSNESGFYRQGYGWQMRWENGTGYVNKNGQGGGTSASILDSSNYTSWAAPRNYVGDSYVDFYIYGDQNTYYPVTIQNYNNGYGFQRYSISRGYSWTAPWNPIGTGSHQGGLTFTFEWAGDIAWGGNDKSFRIIEFAEQYTTMVAGMQLAHCEGLIVWLRGGGSGGAHYRLHGPGGIVQGYSINMSSWTSCAGVTYSPRSYDSGTVSSEINSKYPIRGYGNSDIYVNNSIVWHQGNLTNLNQLTNGPGYITSSALGSYLPLSGGTLSGNLNIQTGNNPAHFLLRGTNPEMYIDAGYGGGTARLFINRAGTGNQAALHFTTGATVTPGTAWNFTGAPLWTMGMTNSSQTSDFKIAYGDIYDSPSVAIRIDTSKNAYFSASVTVASDLSGSNVYTTGGWFRNHTNNNGIYWSATAWHIYPKNANDMYMRSGANDSSLNFLRSDGTSVGYIHCASDFAMGFLTSGRSWRLRVEDGGRMQAYGPIARSAHAAGFLEGSYNNIGGNSANTNPIYTIGSSYNPTDSSLSNMYGIGYAHPNLWGSGKTSDWGLYVVAAGTINVTLGSGSTSIWAQNDIVAYSDIRVKDNIEVIEDAVSKVRAIRGVTFTRIDSADKNKRHAGVIAQEVLKVLPEVVVGTEEDMYSVAYGNLTSLLIEAIKEQQTQIEELKSKLDGLTK
jgi:hypothetical protein